MAEQLLDPDVIRSSIKVRRLREMQLNTAYYLSRGHTQAVIEGVRDSVIVIGRIHANASEPKLFVSSLDEQFLGVGTNILIPVLDDDEYAELGLIHRGVAVSPASILPQGFISEHDRRFPFTPQIHDYRTSASDTYNLYIDSQHRLYTIDSE